MNSAYFQKKEGNFLIVNRKDEFHHLVKVLRVRPGEKVRLLGEDGAEYLCKVDVIDFRKKLLRARMLEEALKKRELPFKISIAFSPPSEDRASDVLIEKCTEIGIQEFIPVFFERSAKKNLRLERWLRIAREAVKQSGRSIVPHILNPISFSKLSDLGEYRYKYFGLIDSNERLACDHIDGDVLVLVGPEGDLTEREISYLIESGFKGVALGPIILRVETAAVVFAALVAYEMGGTD